MQLDNILNSIVHQKEVNETWITGYASLSIHTCESAKNCDCPN